MVTDWHCEPWFEPVRRFPVTKRRMSHPEATPALGYKSFDKLWRSIGTFRQEDKKDSLRRFNSWVKQFGVQLAETEHVIDEVAKSNLFTKCLHEKTRLRLENAILPKNFCDYTTTQLVEQTKTFFRRKCMQCDC